MGGKSSPPHDGISASGIKIWGRRKENMKRNANYRLEGGGLPAPVVPHPLSSPKEQPLSYSRILAAILRVYFPSLYGLLSFAGACLLSFQLRILATLTSPNVFCTATPSLRPFWWRVLVSNQGWMHGWSMLRAPAATFQFSDLLPERECP